MTLTAEMYHDIWQPDIRRGWTLELIVRRPTEVRKTCTMRRSWAWIWVFFPSRNSVSPVLRWLMWKGLSCNTRHCHKGGTISGLKWLRTCKARSNYMGWMSLRDLKGILITNFNDMTRHTGRRYRHLVHHLHRRPMQHWCRSLLSVAKHFGNSACHVQPFGAPEMHHVSPSRKCTQMKHWHTPYQHGHGVSGFTW